MVSAEEHRCVLYLVYEPYNVDFGLKLAQYGREDGNFHVIIWSPYYFEDTAFYQNDASGQGAIYINETNRDGSLAGLHDRLSGWFSASLARLPLAQRASASKAGSALLDKLEVSHPELASAAQQKLDTINRRINICEDWLVRLGVDALVLPEDNCERDSACWVEAARLRGIPATVVTTAVADPTAAETVYRDSDLHRVEGNLLDQVRVSLPHWLVEKADYAITRLPISDALSMELAGLAPPHPWINNSSSNIVVAVESDALKDAYIKMGLDGSRFVSTGHPNIDLLHHSIVERNSLFARARAEHQLQADQPVCLLNVPPNRLGNRSAPGFDDYSDIVEALVAATKSGWQGHVIASVHPSMTETERLLLQDCGCLVLNWPIAELIAIADVFVTSRSSTIKWALAASLPVVSVQIYDYEPAETEFDQQTMKVSLQELHGHLQDFVSSPPARADKVTAERWGILDGCGMDRIVQLAFRN